MDATCSIQDSIHVFSLVHKYVSRILGTYQNPRWAVLSSDRNALPDLQNKQISKQVNK